MVPVEQIAKVGENALTVLESVIRLLGPFRPGHPQWKLIQEEALKSLSPVHGELAREMARAIKLQRRAMARLGQVKHEKEQLDQAAYYAQPAWFIVRELRRLRLVEYLGPACDPPIKVLGSAEELREVGDQVLKSKMRFALRARDTAVKCELEARPAIAAAEHGLVTKWVEVQRAILDPLVAEFRGLVTKYKWDLAALVEPATKLLLGRWTGSSHCAAILEMLSEAADQLRKPLFSETLRPVFSLIDWKSLRHQFENELGVWHRSRAGSRPVSIATPSIDYIFERIIVAAGGEKLSAEMIFERAKSNPQTADLFRMPSVNSDHRERIRGLIDKETKDGFFIRADAYVSGRTRMIWSEPARAQAHADPSES